ncbi:MAG: hypothetical protein WD011_04660 [Nitriliruptoraceae bacterium]
MDGSPHDHAEPTRPATGADEPHRMPGWVKAIVAIGLLALLVALVLAFGGGDHGPGRHQAGASELEQPVGVASAVETQAPATRPADRR